MKICIIGTGYVGLVTGVCLSDLGNDVVCIDKNIEKINLLNQNISPIFEHGLDSLITKNVTAGRLFFSQDTQKAVSEAEIIYIAVGTPSTPTGEADIAYVIEASKDIGNGILNSKSNLIPFRVIVNKSTVPIGTGHIIQQTIEKIGVSTDRFGVVSNPEFLREGSAINDALNPDRIIIGSTNEKALMIMDDLYKSMFRIKCPIIKTNLETAELIKYASNAFLATKISFINEIANLCDLLGADVHVVANGMGADNRIGKYFLHPGPGYGGSCFPKDTIALMHIAEKIGYDFKLIKAVIKVNSHQKQIAIHKLLKLFNNQISGKTIAILGLSFKPNTDDMRDAPSLAIIQELIKLGAKIQGYDPVSMKNAKALLHDSILFTADAYSCVKHTDAAVIVTEWNDFKLLDIHRLKINMNTPNIIDMRNIYEPEKMSKAGFNYIGLGRR